MVIPRSVGTTTRPATPSLSDDRRPSRLQRLFIVVVLLTCLAHAATLTRSPPAWQDEVQIIDYGRTLLPGSDQTYAVNWIAGNRPSLLPNAIGPLIQEAAYRMSSGTMIGPRLSSLLGAAVAACLLHGWLVAAGVSSWIAVATGLVFFWDPLFASSYRSVRVDSWCMAAMLASLWSVRVASRPGAGYGMLIAAGAFVAVGALVWPSAILFVPLLVHEIHLSSRSASGDPEATPDGLRWRRFLTRSLVVAAAAFFMMLLVAPFAGRLGEMFGDLSDGIARVRVTRHTPLLGRLWTLVATFFNCPPLPLAAIGGAILVGPRSWLVPLAAALVLAISSEPYAYRTVYTVPYFAYGFALAASAWLRVRPSRAVSRNPLVWLVAVMLLWSGGISLFIRTAVAVIEWEQRDPDSAVRFVDGLGGSAGTRVLLDSWSLYYAVRSRRWAYWGPYDRRRRGDIARSLDYDYVIHDESAGVHPLDGTLRKLGYRREVVHLGTGQSSVRPFLPGVTARYGPYVVYTRPDTPVDGGSGGR